MITRPVKRLGPGDVTATPTAAGRPLRHVLSRKAGFRPDSVRTNPNPAKSWWRRRESNPPEMNASRMLPKGWRRSGGGAMAQTPTPKCAEGRGADETRTKPASPRAALLASLAAGMRAALAAGDVEAARIANEAIGGILGAAGAESAGSVIDLAAERGRRG